jgi:hypothetical protein
VQDSRSGRRVRPVDRSSWKHPSYSYQLHPQRTSANIRNGDRSSGNIFTSGAIAALLRDWTCNDNDSSGWIHQKACEFWRREPRRCQDSVQTPENDRHPEAKSPQESKETGSHLSVTAFALDSELKPFAKAAMGDRNRDEDTCTRRQGKPPDGSPRAKSAYALASGIKRRDANQTCAGILPERKRVA